MEKNKENRKIILVLFLGVLMGALDIAVVGPALNPIKNWFHASGRDMTWIFTSYVLMNLVGTPILAKISDAVGKKPVYIASLITFAFGSLVVSLAPVFPVLIIGRAVQGFGAGGIFPVASAVIGDTFPPDKRGKMLGLIGAVFGIAFIIGPVIGGLLLLLGWQWIFVVNLPIALLVIILAIKYIPNSHVQRGEKLDWLGTLVISVMLASFVYGTNQIETHKILSSIISRNVYPFLLG
ncbi:MAG: MFS transporter, partial [Bacillota bacterium]